MFDELCQKGYTWLQGNLPACSGLGPWNDSARDEFLTMRLNDDVGIFSAAERGLQFP